jgi:hypothetical protein
MRIKRYHLASAVDTQTLQNEVGKLVAEGWQPVGPVVVAEPSGDSRDRFIQTLVQYEGEIRS